MERVVKIGLKILYQILVILCLIVAVIIVFQKVTDSNRSIAGYRIFRVITGSMEPAYDVGEVVISKEVNPHDIKVGDDIVYLGNYGEYQGKIIMHAVIGIDENEDGSLNFHAKGLHSSSVEDPQIKESQIYGVVKFKSGILTVLYKVATNIYSLFVIIIVLVLNVFISFKEHGKKDIQKLNSSSGKRLNVTDIEENTDNSSDEYEIEDNEESKTEEQVDTTSDKENEKDDDVN